MSYLHFAVVEFSLHFGRYVFLVGLVGVLLNVTSLLRIE
jgi:hypothetical protein